jgi:thioredoxin reductase (NADPH)
VADIYDEIHEVLIAGSGPAGLTAAIYAARADLNPVMVEGEAAGGQLVDTTDVENYPGFPEGIMGPELIEVMKKQAERFGTRVLTNHIVSCDLSKRPFTLELQDGKKLKSKTLIISTGASARWLGLESENKLKGHGVTACATCDGFFFKGKEVAVVGGGDTAMEEALFLTKFCSKVTVIHRRDELRASKIMQDRAFKHDKIEFKWNSVVEEVYDPAENKVTGLKLRNTQDDSTEDFKCEGLFMAIGHDPNTQFLGGQVELDDQSFIKVEHPSTRTSVPGVFACGDVMDPHYKQAVTAAGTGCRAAMDAEKFLEAEKG